jgi:hypothetical protein
LLARIDALQDGWTVGCGECRIGIELNGCSQSLQRLSGLQIFTATPVRFESGIPIRFQASLFPRHFGERQRTPRILQSTRRFEIGDSKARREAFGLRMQRFQIDTRKQVRQGTTSSGCPRVQFETTPIEPQVKLCH